MIVSNVSKIVRQWKTFNHLKTINECSLNGMCMIGNDTVIKEVKVILKWI